jgi:hypothetical protein
MHVFFIRPIPRRSHFWQIELLSLDVSGIFERAVPVFESGMAPGLLIKLPVHNMEELAKLKLGTISDADVFRSTVVRTGVPLYLDTLRSTHFGV